MENDQNFSNYIDVNDCLKNKSYLELSRKHSDKKLEDNKPNILSPQIQIDLVQSEIETLECQVERSKKVEKKLIDLVHRLYLKVENMYSIANQFSLD